MQLYHDFLQGLQHKSSTSSQFMKKGSTEHFQVRFGNLNLSVIFEKTYN